MCRVHSTETSYSSPSATQVVSLTAEDPANPAPEDFVTTETVPAALHYRGNDAVLLTNVRRVALRRIRTPLTERAHLRSTQDAHV